ncbi:MAG: hypothetical protein ACHREM_11505 [Polyangiales bacterium]
MASIRAIADYPASDTPRTVLDRFTIAVRADRISATEVGAVVSVADGAVFVALTKVRTCGGSHRIVGELLFEVPPEIVLARSDLRSALYFATGDADLADGPAAAALRAS